MFNLGNKPSYVFFAFIVETLSRFSCAASLANLTNRGRWACGGTL
ncbi:hypothetical protein AAHB56_05120 [Bacillus thuringiensis]